MVFHSSFISGLDTGLIDTMSKQNNDPSQLEGDDPLLQIQFHDLEDECSPQETDVHTHATPFLSKKSTAIRRKVEGLTPPQGFQAALAKKRRLSSVPTAAMAVALATRKQAAAAKAKPKQAPLHASLLHQSCRLFPQIEGVIQSSVEMEPQKAAERAPGAPTGSYYLVGDGREPYSLPINILLQHDATLGALAVVAKAAPEALAMKDGRDDSCSVIIALRLLGSGTCKEGGKSIPEELLTINQEAAQVHDRKMNFPLHIAAYVGASFDMIEKLYWAFPEALLAMNFYAETPLDIAFRNGKCEDRAIDYLREKMEHLKAARLTRLANLKQDT